MCRSWKPLRQKLNALMPGKILVVENSDNVVNISHNHQIPMSCQHLELHEQHLPPHPVIFPETVAPRVNIGSCRPRDSTGRFIPQPDLLRMHNEPGSSSRDGQPINVDAPDHAVVPKDAEMSSGEFDVGAEGEKPNLQPVPEQPIMENSVCRTTVAAVTTF